MLFAPWWPTIGGHASGGAPVLNGATLSLAVVVPGSPPAVGGAVPHG